MKQALEALEHCLHYAQTHLQHFDAAYNRHRSTENERGVITDEIEETFAAITALRERLAQPEQKPQMQPCAGRNCGSTNPNLHSAECFEDYEKSTGMRQWQGLTDDEVSEILDEVIGFNSCFGPETDFARAIEAKLREKNT